MTAAKAAVSMDFVVMLELTSMTDPKLEEEIALLKGCMETLKRFHDIFDNAILTEMVVPEDEESIQELRNILPGQWDSLLRELALPGDDSVHTVVEMVSALPVVITLTDFQRRKLYDVWHKAYMKLHFLLGKLQYRKEKLELLRPGRLKAKKIIVSPAFVIVVALVALVLYIVLR